ncbi:MAG TPA: cytochrome c [Polyangiaceae bacterium]|nr:cytochrome c [Polyangiaceae bacterium]
MTRSFAGFCGLLGVCWLLGCDRPAPDLAEWTTADHHHQAEKKQRRQMGTPSTYTQPSQRNVLVEVTWMKQCASCHGKRGRGDGPQSPMVKAKDLTVREWQDSVTDEAIAKVIREGKDKMPSFSFPEGMLTDLVAHVRTLGTPKQRPGAPGAAPAGEPEEEAEAAEASKPSGAPAPKDGTAKNDNAAPAAPSPGAPASAPSPGH